MSDEGEPDPRLMTARLLIHGITGDSWGVQESLMRENAAGFVDGFTERYKLAWQVGVVLRDHIPQEERDRLVRSLRDELIQIEKILGGDW